MRLFFAVELDEAVRRAAAAVASDLAVALRGAGGADVSWVRPDNMHLTVRFLGETAPERARELAAVFGTPLATDPFELRFSGVGAFPPRGAARVLWVGMVAGQDRLAAVHREVEERLAGLGIPGEDRPFRAHLTLGRVRSRLGPKASAAIASVSATGLPACTARELTLFESRLSPHGSVYTALVRTPLGTAHEDRR